jgi:Prokaryotic homologs of the JAB domain
VKTLLLAVVLVLSCPPVLQRADVCKAVAEIKRDSFGPLHIEYALLVTRTGLTFVSGTSEDVTYTLSPDIIAVIHTHPDKGHERPSAQDVKTAHETGVPVYVVSADQVWAALPNGEVLPVSTK